MVAGIENDTRKVIGFQRAIKPLVSMLEQPMQDPDVDDELYLVFKHRGWISAICLPTIYFTFWTWTSTRQRRMLAGRT